VVLGIVIHNQLFDKSVNVFQSHIRKQGACYESLAVNQETPFYRWFLHEKNST
jgi:hypothetical protein